LFSSWFVQFCWPFQPMYGRSPSKRGVGCQFGPDVTRRFLEANNLDYIIRSHEVKVCQPTGLESVGPDVMRRFLEANNLDYIIRSHEVKVCQLTGSRKCCSWRHGTLPGGQQPRLHHQISRGQGMSTNRIQDFDDQNWRKNTAENFLYIFWSKFAIGLSLSLHKGLTVQATGEAFSPKKRTSSAKNAIYKFFLYLWFIFALLDPDPDCEYGSGYGSRDIIESVL